MFLINLFRNYYNILLFIIQKYKFYKLNKQLSLYQFTFNSINTVIIKNKKFLTISFLSSILNAESKIRDILLKKYIFKTEKIYIYI